MPNATLTMASLPPRAATSNGPASNSTWETADDRTSPNSSPCSRSVAASVGASIARSTTTGRNGLHRNITRGPTIRPSAKPVAVGRTARITAATASLRSDAPPLDIPYARKRRHPAKWPRPRANTV